MPSSRYQDNEHIHPQLIAQVAALLLDAQLQDLFAPLPPPMRAALRAAMERAAPDDPERQLLTLRRLIRRRTRSRQAGR